ncbi:MULTISPECIES: replication initiation protein [Rufibacter]|uniref:RepB family plasmid replication initiator protein n=1 Tax=Rufibacter latericius TaxID=2487040 RepID=A0A3M9MEN9_9BACT|nr:MULTISPECIES: replication initiation protein [Rufibacter]RNI24042.1 RepB family plasmid replication initiator protein [Rufibacter latericius]
MSTVDKKGKGNKRTGVVKLPDTMTWIKQPNKVTKMGYDFTVLQLRVFLSILVELQGHMEEVIQGKEVEQLNLFQRSKGDSIRLTIPIKKFGVTPDKYNELKMAMRKIAAIPVELDARDPESGKEYWVVKGLFTAYIPKEKYSREVIIEIEKPIAKYLLDTKPGWSKFMYEIVNQSNNKYTFRIYILISSWKRKGGLRIPYADFRKMLGIGDRYAEYKDLYKRVIKPAYDELFEKADCWFEMAEVEKKGKEVTHLNFKIIKIMTEQERKIYDAKSDQLINWCKTHHQFKDHHLKALYMILNEETINPLHTKAAMLTGSIDTAKVKNVADYVLKALQNEVAAFFESEDVETEAIMLE